ncbi:MAG: hypothetical protein JWO60_3384 [Frankiales bacterium]|nr:hypothetical protein [Frankiales bacterium]
MSQPLATTLEPGGSAGYLALLLVVLLFVATGLLIRNMSSRLKRLPKDFPETAPEPAPREDPQP